MRRQSCRPHSCRPYLNGELCEGRRQGRCGRQDAGALQLRAARRQDLVARLAEPDIVSANEGLLHGLVACYQVPALST